MSTAGHPAQDGPVRPARISLCMVVRDEAHQLARCIDAARLAFDEVVVVDTGSADDTVAVAASLGAIVAERPWRDDFAWARNEALALATGDWVLVLDADEVLVSGAEAIRELTRRDDADCGLLVLCNAPNAAANPADVVSGAARLGSAILLPRLFRRTPDLTWEGRIHERPAAWLAASTHRLCSIDARLAHYGAHPEVRLGLRKAERNARLLERAAAEGTARVIDLAHLADEYLALDQTDRAWDAAEQGMAALRDAWTRGEEPYCYELLRLYAELQLWRGDLDGATQTALALAARYPAWPDARFLAARTAELQAWRTGAPPLDLLEEVAADFEQLLRDDRRAWPSPPADGVTSWRAHLRLATTLLSLGRAEQARPHALAAVAAQPDDLEARLAAAEATGDLDPIADCDAPDALVLRAAAASPADRPTLLGAARAALPAGLWAPHRLRLLLALARSAA